MTAARIELTRAQVLAFRRHAGELDARLPMSAASLRRAAWAGLKDSMPRAALLSLHARVEQVHPESHFDEALVQLWGPCYHAYVVPKPDIAPFTLGRQPTDPVGRARAQKAAAQLRELLGDARAKYGAAGRALDVIPNLLRYGTTTGTILMRWEGARQPVVWMVDPPEVDPLEARLDLARRYLHVLGPGRPGSFAEWAGVKPHAADSAFEALAKELVAARTPLGDAWLLESDENAARTSHRTAAAARLLPSGDTYYLLWGVDRELLLADPAQRAELWTSRVWPGAVMVEGEVVGTWRRAGPRLSILPFGTVRATQRAAVEDEAASLPLPRADRVTRIDWADPLGN